MHDRFVSKDGQFASFYTLLDWQPAIWILVALMVFVSIFATWVGFSESDDVFYAQAASGWRDQGWFLGTTHWALRHVIVIPMAGLFALFGVSETTMVLPSVVYGCAVAALLGRVAWRLGGWSASACTIAVTGTLPVFATGISLVSTDGPEAMFLIASLWLFYRGMKLADTRRLIGSGMLAGLALATRETSVALLVFYAILFGFGYGGPRRYYLWAGLGFLAVSGLDWLYLTSMSGDPLYRLHVALAGAHGDGPHMEAFVTKTPGLDHFGSLEVWRWLKPVAATAANQNFGLLVWFAVPATVWLIRSGPPSSRQVSLVLGGFALTWFAVLGYGLTPWLWVIPRYYFVLVVLTVPLGVAVSRVASGHRLIAAGTLAVLIGSNILLDLGATTDQMAGERALASFAGRTEEPVFTDPATLQGAHWLLAQQSRAGQVAAAIPLPGMLYFYNNRPRRAQSGSWPIQSPPGDWTEIERLDVPPKWTQAFAAPLGLGGLLPGGLMEKLDAPLHEVRVFRVPAASTVSANDLPALR